MKREAIAVLDVGKTNLKILAVDSSGNALSAESTPSRGSSGFLDSEFAWNWLLDGTRRLAENFDLSAIVPTAHGAAAALVDMHGLVHPVPDYEAPIPADIDRAYDRLRPTFDKTYSPRLPAGLNLGRQFYQIGRSAPSVLTRAAWFLTYPQYFAWRLTGIPAAEATSLGCHTDLWLPASGRLSPLVDEIGLRHLTPPLRRPNERLGKPLPELGLPECDVLCGIHDSNAAYLRYLASAEEPFAVLSTGTWFVCFNGSGQLASLDPARDTLANVDALGRPVACSRFMGGREHEAIAGSDRQTVTTPEDLAEIVRLRIFALPSLTETGGPFPQRKGYLTGAPQTGAARHALATLYVALMSRESLWLSGSFEHVFIDGPFAHDPLFGPILAALLPDARLYMTTAASGAGIGAAILQAWRGQMPPRIPLKTTRVHPVAIDIGKYAEEWRNLVGHIA